MNASHARVTSLSVYEAVLAGFLNTPVALSSEPVLLISRLRSLREGPLRNGDLLPDLGAGGAGAAAGACTAGLGCWGCGGLGVEA